MPDLTTHLNQARHNEEFLERIDCGQDGDWAVTALFYAALHYVDAYLAKSHRAHPGRHAERDRLIQADPKTNGIRSKYRRLQDSSQDARYNAVAYTPQQIAILRRNDFEPLKHHLTL